ncbi:MAG: phosphoribosylanthranilate isomerase [Betaproteobacteria bacterium]|nr:phosphoribosylanthranilate isomerase [Betaproteobacteria bacterium]MBI2960619.1 phosphoribosylanthranilate isomerase [Betaproteobacteria bacterium]
MRTRIKICGITREADARAAASAGADAIGFIFWRPSERFIEPERAGAIARALPAFVSPVGVFVNPGIEEVEAVLAHVPHALLQFHGEESPEFCSRFARPYLRAARMRPGLDLLEYFAPFAAASAWLVDAFHDSAYGGTGTAFDWDLVPRRLERPLVLSGGLTVDNVSEAVRRVRPFAVDVSSGVESGKGIKEATKIAAFIAGVRCADQ